MEFRSPSTSQHSGLSIWCSPFRTAGQSLWREVCRHGRAHGPEGGGGGGGIVLMLSRPVVGSRIHGL